MGADGGISKGTATQPYQPVRLLRQAVVTALCPFEITNYPIGLHPTYRKCWSLRQSRSMLSARGCPVTGPHGRAIGAKGKGVLWLVRRESPHPSTYAERLACHPDSQPLSTGQCAMVSS